MAHGFAFVAAEVVHVASALDIFDPPAPGGKRASMRCCANGLRGITRNPVCEKTAAGPLDDSAAAITTRIPLATVPHDNPRSTSGFLTARPAKRLKSRSADHNSRTPCWRHRAATRAS